MTSLWRRMTLTWVGHATVLLQVAGKNILTDPLFSERASPVQWAGPKRVAPLGVSFEDLPPIDMVVISHDHYDALDEPTIMKLRQRTRGGHTTSELTKMAVFGLLESQVEFPFLVLHGLNVVLKTQE